MASGVASHTSKTRVSMCGLPSESANSLLDVSAPCQDDRRDSDRLRANVDSRAATSRRSRIGCGWLSHATAAPRVPRRHHRNCATIIMTQCATIGGGAAVEFVQRAMSWRYVASVVARRIASVWTCRQLCSSIWPPTLIPMSRADVLTRCSGAVRDPMAWSRMAWWLAVFAAQDHCRQN